MSTMSSKVKELHSEFLRSPLSRQKGQAAIRLYSRARAELAVLKQKQRALYEQVMAVKRETEEQEHRLQQALENMILGYGHVPFEAEGVYYDIGCQGDKLYSIRRVLPLREEASHGKR